VLVAVLYAGLGVTTILILRKMSRRFRENTVGDDEVPYGPSGPPPSHAAEDEVTVS